jgi:hypothetical protein
MAHKNMRRRDEFAIYVSIFLHARTNLDAAQKRNKLVLEEQKELGPKVDKTEERNKRKKLGHKIWEKGMAHIGWRETDNWKRQIWRSQHIAEYLLFLAKKDT